jgi:hypothetical protein
MTLFFGLTGSVIFLGMGPVLLVMWLAGVGLGTLTWKTFGMVLAKGLLDNVLSDYLWARAILLVGEELRHRHSTGRRKGGGGWMLCGAAGPPGRLQFWEEAPCASPSAGVDAACIQDSPTACPPPVLQGPR